MRNASIALGFTNTVDYELDWDSINIGNLVGELGITKSDIINHRTISNLKDLVANILYYMDKGEGCGKFIDSEEPLLEIMDGRTSTISLGGTAIRAAQVIASKGIDCLISLSATNKETRMLLPSGCTTFCSSEIDYDSPHVVIQYPAGTTVIGPDFSITTARHNRLIFTADKSNSNLRIPDSFLSSIGRCDAFIISSFELIEDDELLENLLSKIDKALQSFGGIVFYEDAFFKETSHAKMVNSHLSKHHHIHSMNEDEFAFYLGEKPILLDPIYMSKACSAVRDKIGTDVLLLHTSRYGLLQGKNSHEYADALESGILFSSTRFAFGNDLSSERLESVKKGKQSEECRKFAEEIEELMDCICIPSYDVPTDKPTTIGLGDTFVGGFAVGLLNRNKQKEE